MSKSIIMTTSAALVLMSSVAFSGPRGLDEFTIQVLGYTASPQEIAEIVNKGKRGRSASAASSNGSPPDWAMAHGLDLAVLDDEDPTRYTDPTPEPTPEPTTEDPIFNDIR